MSEGIEVKDVKWANKEIKKVRDLLNNKRYEEEVDDLTTGFLSGLNKALSILDQLDEPETLSQEWIYANSKLGAFTYSNGVDIGYFVKNGALEDKLVPEKELSVIPKFVADYIQEGKDLGCDLGTAMTVRTETLKDIRDYIKNNEEIFARAWLDGYTIRKKHKYHAKVKGWGINGNDGHAYYSGKFPLSLTTTTESVAHTKDEWRNYGVYKDNADFLLVEEL